MNIFLFFGIAFIIIFGLGYLLEKIKVPWIFAALFLGLMLSEFPNLQIVETGGSEVFEFFARLGMYFLLFLIGYELNLKKIKKLGKFIISSTLIIIFGEAFFGGLLIHYVFDYNWLISAVVALSFATVGEAVLIPILDEFKLTKTKLGQTILGIGTFDDTIEIFLVILVIFLLPILQQNGSTDFALIKTQLISTLLGLGVLGFFSVLLIKLKKRTKILKIMKVDEVFFLVIAVFFLFLGFSYYAGENLVALGAILSGIALGNFLPSNKKLTIDKEMKALAFGFFGPIFFLWVGLDTDLKYLISAPGLILLFIVVAKSVKIILSYLLGRKTLGVHQSIVMGIALGVRFSTSIVLIKFLFEKNVIGNHLYSVLIGTTIAFKFIIPVLLAYFIQKWNIGAEKKIALHS